jgi:hypothetical protein
MRVSTHPGRLRSPAQGTPRPEPITEAVLNPTIAIGRSEGVTVMDRELTTEHTPTAAEKQKSSTTKIRCRAFSCPSWARTKTLLIQSRYCGAAVPVKLPGNGHLLSIGARIPAVVCPLVPGETTAKLRQCSRRVGFPFKAAS